MALISPGIQVTVTDESNYLPTAVGSVPFVLIATAENKTAAGSSSIAVGTTKVNAGIVNVVSSQRELVSLFGYPTFRTSSAGTPLHGDELNEYGLMAAYSALGVGNRAYIIRADVDLEQLVGTTVRPTGNPDGGATWLDLNETRWGLNVWDRAANTSVLTAPKLITNVDQVVGGVPTGGAGTTGDYAIVTTSTDNQMFYKAGSVTGANIAAHSWTVVGSDEWHHAVPTRVSDSTVGSVVGGANLVINSVNVQISSSPTLNAIVTSIRAAAIPGVSAGADNSLNLLHLFATANAKSNGSTVDGKLALSGNAWLLSNIAISSGTYNCPAVSFSKFQPTWKTFDSDERPSESVWINTSTAGSNSANLNIKVYNSATSEWDQVGAPMYGDDYLALYGMDPITGGTGIAEGSIYVKFDSLEDGTIDSTGTISNGTVSYTPFVKTVTGILKVTGAVPLIAFTPGDSFTVQASVPGSIELSDIVTVTLTGSTAASFVSDFAANVGPQITNVVATLEDTGAISLSHLAGGYLRLTTVTGSPLTVAGFSSTVDNMRVDVDNADVLIASPFEPLTFTSSTDEPFSNPDDGTIWYFGSPTEVDIMVHDGSGWKGYRTVNSDARGYNLAQTDPSGVIFGSVAPTSQIDGDALKNGDLWIDTGDLENYPKIHRYSEADREWILIDNTDHLTEDGIIFADARWDATGNTNPINDTLATVSTLALSDWIDSDAPDYRLYARGTLLFNTRRSGYNVKKFVSNYFNSTSFPTDQDGAHAHTELDAWVSTSGLKEDGSPYMGRRAVRAVVVKALQAAVDSSTAIREDQIDFNLITCPAYTELLDNLSMLNADRKGTAHIIGDTPMRLAASSTALASWGASVPATNGEDGFVTVDNTISLFYPCGLANDLQGNTIAVPASHMMLRTMIRNDDVAYPWFAPAGTRRGTIDNVSAIGYVEAGTNNFVRVGINESLRDVLYNNNLNPITILPGIGLVNFGNKTRAGMSTALDRINVSRLVSYIRRQLAQVANNYLFEPNDAITRNSIKLLVGGLLNDLIAKRGLTDYLVVCDETNNTPDRIARNELYVDVAVEPTKSVEFIYIPIRIKNPGEIKGGNAASSNNV